jgi:hypothetical protein
MNIKDIKLAAEQDLIFFIKLIAPHRLIGAIHEDVINWWCKEDANDHQLLLLPRGHQKSALVAYRVAWEITRDPATTILYVSATRNLAEKQLRAIRDILNSDIYRRYWPEMTHVDEGKREKWTANEICVDHPKRKAEGVRDSTVFTAGLTTTITGLHCDIAVLDDVVVKENAYTTDGRQKVNEQYSLYASIENAGAKEWAVGTRYHPKDLYSLLIELESEVYDDDGALIDKVKVYEVKEHVVEDRGDGTGEFLWPRQRRADGKWFGFDRSILATKRAQYLDKTQYRAQYYNDPNDPESQYIDPERFNYYDKNNLRYDNGKWFYKNNRLNVFASVDFAYSLSKRADYTAIVVVGVDSDHNYYVLDIDRFKTERISEYFSHILKLYSRWGFRKLRAEVSVAQAAIVRELKDSYIKPNGLLLSIDPFRPNRHQGAKEERLRAILEPRYDNGQVYHYRGGHCQTLEEELILTHPPHDDVKDALASVMDIAIAPSPYRNMIDSKRTNIVSNGRFGGMG